MALGTDSTKTTPTIIYNLLLFVVKNSPVAVTWYIKGGEKGDFEAWFCPVLEAQKTDWLEIRKCTEKQDSKQHMHDTFLALSPWVLTFFFYYWLALSCKTYQHAISWHLVDTRWQGGFCKCYSVAYRTLCLLQQLSRKLVSVQRIIKSLEDHIFHDYKLYSLNLLPSKTLTPSVRL